MRFMMLMIPHVYQPDAPATVRAAADFTPPAKAVARMMKFNVSLANAGALLSLDGLHPLAKGARIVFEAGRPHATDGPIATAKEVVGGFWIIQVDSKEAAVEWARRCPAADGDVVEVRQLFEVSDFPPKVRQIVDKSSMRAQHAKAKTAKSGNRRKAS